MAPLEPGSKEEDEMELGLMEEDGAASLTLEEPLGEQVKSRVPRALEEWPATERGCRMTERGRRRGKE